MNCLAEAKRTIVIITQFGSANAGDVTSEHLAALSATPPHHHLNDLFAKDTNSSLLGCVSFLNVSCIVRAIMYD